jgi:hypothetical protein
MLKYVSIDKSARYDTLATYVKKVYQYDISFLII